MGPEENGADRRLRHVEQAVVRQEERNAALERWQTAVAQQITELQLGQIELKRAQERTATRVQMMIGGASLLLSLVYFLLGR